MIESDLKILICCKNVPHHNWMTFCSWYSIYKNLPDAMVFINCEKTFSKIQLFDWVRRYQIPMVFGECEFDGLKIGPEIMAVREFDESDLGPSLAKSENLSTFVNYSECGKFVLSEWINKVDNPFYRAESRFITDVVTANELRVFKLWEKMRLAFQAVS